MDDTRRSERTTARLIVAVAALAFVALLVLGGPFYQSFDEAKYLGLGHNLFAGHGYTTVFGATFTTHSPAWPAILVAPEVWLGVDALTWGRVLNYLSGAGLVLACAAFAWRICCRHPLHCQARKECGCTGSTTTPIPFRSRKR